MSGIEEQNLHLFCAQEMNNSAAMCLEKGMCQQAVSSLHSGLKLLIAMNHHSDCSPESSYCCSSGAERDPLWHPVDCDHPCTLDDCIAFSEQTSFLINNNCGNNTSPKRTDRSRGMDSIYSHKRDVASGFPTTALDSRGSTPNNGYVYKRPIQVPLEGFCYCHKGYTSLLVIIVLNLAIAHDLDATEGSCETKTEHIIFLYRLCLHLLHQTSSSSPSPSSSFLSPPSSSPSPSSFSSSSLSSSLPTTTGTTVSSAKTSIRCEMIVHNNLSQLYRMNGNPSNHKKSMQDLLSFYMVLIERGTRDSSGGVSGSFSYNNNNYYWWDVSRWASEQSELVEGVLENLDPLICRAHCADAA